MKTLKKLVRDNSGMALPMALVLLVVVSLMVVPVVSLINTNLVSTISSNQGVKSYYSADAAVNYGLWKMVYDENYTLPTTTDTITLPETLNSVEPQTVTITNNGHDPSGDTVFIIQSSATNDILQFNDDPGVNSYASVPSTTSAKAYVNVTSGSDESSVFKYALATLGGDVIMTGSAGIDCIPKEPETTCHDGDVWINGDIYMGWSNFINGLATLTGDVISPNPNPSITDGVVQGEAPPRPTWLDDKTNEFIASTAVSMPSFGGTCTSWSDVATVYNNPVCVNGNMNLSQTGTYRFKDTVYVSGNMVVNGGVNHIIFEKSVKVDGYINLGGNGTIVFLNNAINMVDTVPYAAYSPQTISGSAVNVSGYTASVVLTAGTISNGGTLSVKIQESDSSTGPWSDVSGGTFTSVNKFNDNATYAIDYSGDKSYLRSVATLTGANGTFGVQVQNMSDISLNNILSVGDYLYAAGSRSTEFDGKVVVNGESLYSNYAVYFDGSGYSGAAFDVVFSNTLRVAGNAKFGSGRDYSFSNVIYTTGNLVMDGNSGSVSLGEALVADGAILISGSADFGDDPITAPFLISRKIGCCIEQSSCSSTCDGVCLTGNTPVTAIIYAPDSRAYVSGSSTFNGAMVTKCAQLDGNVRLKYPVVLDDREDITSSSAGGSVTLSSYSIN